RALSRNRDDRFSSARAFGEALAQALGPLGGAATAVAIGEEVSRSFEATLAEQRMILRIAREGGQFDLERPSPVLAHGTTLTTTPISNIQRRVEQAQAEVAQFVAASQAIESLYADAGMKSRPHRSDTEGAFTPAPSRRSAALTSEDEPESGIIVAPAPTSQPQPVVSAAMREDETDEEPRTARAVVHRPVATARSSKLPWAIAIVAVLAIGAAAVMFYLEHQAATPASAETAEPVVMTPSPAAPAVTTDEPAADGEKIAAVDPPVGAGDGPATEPAPDATT